MTAKKFEDLFSKSIRHAEKGRGIALVDNWSYCDCILQGEYPCYPKSAWLEAFDEDDIYVYGLPHAMSRADERLFSRINGSHFGDPIYGSTGSYTVR